MTDWQNLEESEAKPDVRVAGIRHRIVDVESKSTVQRAIVPVAAANEQHNTDYSLGFLSFVYLRPQHAAYFRQHFYTHFPLFGFKKLHLVSNPKAKCVYFEFCVHLF